MTSKNANKNKSDKKNNKNNNNDIDKNNNNDLQKEEKESSLFNFSKLNNDSENAGNKDEKENGNDINDIDNIGVCEDLIMDYKKKVQKYKKQAQEYLNGWKRCQADYNNLKKERELIYKKANKSILKELIENLLSILTSFKAASDHVPFSEKEKDWVKGIFQVEKMFKDLLSNYGVKEIKTVGYEFDPNFHQAVGNAEDQQYESGVVIKEVSPGYILDDEVIVAAKVIVNK